MSQDLELASTDELLDELMGRFKNAIFCGMKEAATESAYIHRRWQGDYMACTGLSDWIRRCILDQFADLSYGADDEGNPVDDGTDVELDDED